MGWPPRGQPSQAFSVVFAQRYQAGVSRQCSPYLEILRSASQSDFSLAVLEPAPAQYTEPHESTKAQHACWRDVGENGMHHLRVVVRHGLLDPDAHLKARARMG